MLESKSCTDTKKYKRVEIYSVRNVLLVLSLELYSPIGRLSWVASIALATCKFQLAITGARGKY